MSTINPKKKRQKTKAKDAAAANDAKDANKLISAAAAGGGAAAIVQSKQVTFATTAATNGGGGGNNPASSKKRTADDMEQAAVLNPKDALGAAKSNEVVFGVPDTSGNFITDALALGMAVKGNSANAVTKITTYNNTKKTSYVTNWDKDRCNLQNLPVFFKDKPSQFNTGRVVIKAELTEEQAFKFIAWMKTWFKVFWDFTSPGKTLVLVDKDGKKKRATMWRTLVEGNFKDVYPDSDSIIAELRKKWQAKYPDSDLPGDDFDLVWEFREDVGFRENGDPKGKSMLFAERVYLYKNQKTGQQHWLMQLSFWADSTVKWSYHDASGKRVVEDVSVQDLRGAYKGAAGDTFSQLRVTMSPNNTPTGQPSFNFSPVMGYPDVVPLLCGKRGILYVPPDQETEAQRAERMQHEEAMRAKKAKEVEALQNAQFDAAAAK